MVFVRLTNSQSHELLVLPTEAEFESETESMSRKSIRDCLSLSLHLFIKDQGFPYPLPMILAGIYVRKFSPTFGLSFHFVRYKRGHSSYYIQLHIVETLQLLLGVIFPTLMSSSLLFLSFVLSNQMSTIIGKYSWLSSGGYDKQIIQSSCCISQR